jgi:hypothetical protein
MPAVGTCSENLPKTSSPVKQSNDHLFINSLVVHSTSDSVGHHFNQQENNPKHDAEFNLATFLALDVSVGVGLSALDCWLSQGPDEDPWNDIEIVLEHCQECVEMEAHAQEDSGTEDERSVKATCGSNCEGEEA